MRLPNQRPTCMSTIHAILLYVCTLLVVPTYLIYISFQVQEYVTRKGKHPCFRADVTCQNKGKLSFCGEKAIWSIMVCLVAPLYGSP